MKRNVLPFMAGTMVLALSVAACSSSKPQETPSAGSGGGGSAAANAPLATAVTAPGKAKKNYNFQFIQGVSGDEFYITMQCGMQAEAQKLGVSVTTQPGSFTDVMALCAELQPCSLDHGFLFVGRVGARLSCR